MGEKQATPGTPEYDGTLIASVEGLQIYVKLLEPKRTGKRRLWLQVRQQDQKAWRISASLSYVNAADIRFERDS